MKFLFVLILTLFALKAFPSAFIIYNDADKIYLRESLGDGTFTDARIVAEPGSTPKTLAVIDANKDNFQDFISQNNKGTLSLYLNDGSNNFTMSLIEETGMTHISDAASGDFDNDGWDDFIISDRENKKIILYKNNQNLSFDKADIDATWFTGRLRYDAIAGMDAADINGDGNLDFMVLGYYSDGRVINKAYLYIGSGDGSFTRSEALDNRNKDGTYGLAVGDFDGDGNQDVIVGQDDGGDPGQTWLWTGNGRGAFGLAGEAYDISGAESGYDGPGMGYFDAYDFNADGMMDVISAARGIGLFYLQGRGDGSFEEPIQIDDNSKIYGCTTFNTLSNDSPQRKIGKNPIFVYMENESIFLHSVKDDNTFSEKFFIDKIAHGDGITVADFNNDDLLDFTVFTCKADLYSFIRMNGNTFKKTLVEETGNARYEYSLDNASGDFDEDGDIDIIVPHHIDQKLYLYKNDGSGDFPSEDKTELPWLGKNSWIDGTGGLDASDINNDGHLDFLIIDYVENADINDIYLYLGSGDGTFIPSKAFTNTNHNGTLGLAIADFNEDGYDDAVVGQDDGGDVGQSWLYTGDGKGNFEFFGEAYDISPEYESGENRPGSGHFDAYDFDNDGHFDIIATASKKGIYFVKGRGDGTFDEPVQIRATSEPFMWGMGAPNPRKEPPLPDLTILKVNAPATAKAGDKIGVEVEFKNQGAAATSSGEVLLRVLLSPDTDINVDDISIADVPFDKSLLGAGMIIGQTILAQIPADASGSYYIGAYIDAAFSCAESNENNNFLLDSEAINIGEYESWTFAHITDVHIGYDEKRTVSYDIYPSFLELNLAASFCDAIEDIRSLTPHPKFILVTGDIVNWANEYYFNLYKIIKLTYESNYDIPLYEIPGNHDRYKNNVPFNISDNLFSYSAYMPAPSQLIDPDGMRHIKIFEGFQLFDEDNLDNTDYGDSMFNIYFSHKGYLFIGLDSGYDSMLWDDKWDFLPPARGLSNNQINALNQIGEQFTYPKIIFMHHPIFNDSPFGDNGIITNNRPQFLSFCESHNVPLVLSGHTHKDKTTIKNGITYLQTPSVTREDNGADEKGYRIIKVNKSVEPQPYTRYNDYQVTKNMCMADGNVQLTATDSQGREAGFSSDGDYSASISTSIWDSTKSTIPHSYYTGYWGPSKAQAILLYDQSEKYSYHIRGVDTDSTNINLLTPNLSIQVPNIPIFSTTKDSMFFADDSAFVYKTSDNKKPFSISLYKELKTESRSFDISNTTIAKEDSSSFRIVENNAIQYSNIGGTKSYDLKLVHLAAETTQVSYTNLRINANETHILTPTSWEDLDSSDLQVEIDKDSDGTIDSTAIVNPATKVQNKVKENTPSQFNLYPSYPNPFNAQTTIRYDVPVRSAVTMMIYDVLGRKVRTLMNRQVEPGSYSETWNGKNDAGEDLATGMYLVTLRARGESMEETKTMKMVLLR